MIYIETRIHKLCGSFQVLCHAALLAAHVSFCQVSWWKSLAEGENRKCSSI
jgi:hypothetical protein